MIKGAAISAADVQTQMSGAKVDSLRQRSKQLTEQGVKTKAEIEKAAGGFEALMLHQMMSAMWATVQKSGLLGEETNQEQIYRDMFHQAVADSVSKGKGMGLKEMLSREISRADHASNSMEIKTETEDE